MAWSKNSYVVDVRYYTIIRSFRSTGLLPRVNPLAFIFQTSWNDILYNTKKALGHGRKLYELEIKKCRRINANILHVTTLASTHLRVRAHTHKDTHAHTHTHTHIISWYKGYNIDTNYNGYNVSYSPGPLYQIFYILEARPTLYSLYIIYKCI